MGEKRNPPTMPKADHCTGVGKSQHSLHVNLEGGKQNQREGVQQLERGLRKRSMPRKWDWLIVKKRTSTAVPDEVEPLL